MGNNCVCYDKSKDNAEMKTEKENNELCNFNVFYFFCIDRNLDKKILNDYRAMKFIIKLQSYARGMAMRDKIKLRAKRFRQKIRDKNGNNKYCY